MLSVHNSNKIRILYIFIFVFCYYLFLFLSNEYYYGSVSFFHSAYMKLLYESPSYTFSSLPFSIFKENFIDHHYLWHYMLLPFMSLGERYGLAIAISMLNTFFVIVWIFIYEKLTNSNIPFLFLLVFLVSCPDFTRRICMMRIQGASLFFLFTGIYAFMTQKRYLLRSIAFFYPWLYTGFVLLPIATFIISVSNLYGRRKVYIKYWFYNLLIPALIGFVVNPTFPDNLSFIGMYSMQQASNTMLTETNAEYLPPSNFLLFCTYSILALLGTGVSTYIVFFLSKFDPTKRNIYGFSIMCIILMILTLRYARFIEYFYPIAMIVLTVFIYKKNIYNNILFQSFILFVCVFFTMHTFIVFPNAEMTYKNDLLEAGKFLSDIGNEDDIIYNSVWSDFDQLFYMNPNAKYVCGLDQKYLNEFSPYKYKVYFNPTKSKYFHKTKNIFYVLRTEFDADYLVIREAAYNFNLFAGLLAQIGVKNPIYNHGEVLIFSIPNLDE